MNYKLIMLPNPILVSDEEIVCGDMLLSKNYSVFRSEYQSRLPEYNNDSQVRKIIAGIEGLPKLDLSAIAERIGWIDVEKVKFDYFESVTFGWDVESLERYSYEVQQDAEAYVKGFKAAQSLNEKKFDEKDLYGLLKLIGQKGYYVECDGTVYANAFDGGDVVDVVKEYSESLSKPKEYQVELNVLYQSGSGYGEIPSNQPLILNNTIKVTKILS